MEKQDIKISEAFERYRLDQIVYKNESDRTEEMHNLALKCFIDFAEDIPVSEVTFDLVRKWKDHLAKNKKPNTVRGYIIKLRVVIKYLQMNGYNVINHELIGIPKRESTVVDFLEIDEVRTLLRVSFAKSVGYSKFKRYRNRAMIALLFSSGIRNSELCSLNRNQIKKGINDFTIVGKGDKPRLCFMDDITHQYIDEYLALRTDNEPALFIAEQNKGSRISPSTPQEVMRNCRRKAGMKNTVHPHTLRHSFATDLLRNNANLMYVKELLGHTNVATTMCYTHVVNKDLAEIHASKHTAIAI